MIASARTTAAFAGAFARHGNPDALFAMQQIEGSSPSAASARRPRRSRGLLLPGANTRRRRSALRIGSIQDGPARAATEVGGLDRRSVVGHLDAQLAPRERAREPAARRDPCRGRNQVDHDVTSGLQPRIDHARRLRAGLASSVARRSISAPPWPAGRKRPKRRSASATSAIGARLLQQFQGRTHVDPSAQAPPSAGRAACRPRRAAQSGHAPTRSSISSTPPRRDLRVRAATGATRPRG